MENKINLDILKTKNAKITMTVIGLIIAIAIFRPYYHRMSFDSIMAKGDYKEISELLKSDDFLNYATKEQGQTAVKNILANIAKNDNSSRYALLDNVGFKKFGGVSWGEKIVASMTPIILQSSNDEKIEFLGNSEVKKYLDIREKNQIVSSIVDYPITKLSNTQLDKLFIDVCNDTEVEAICKQIKSKFTDLPSDFVSWVVAKCLSAPLDKKMNNLSKLMRNYESAKSHILTMSYEINKDNLNDVNKLESIMNCFFWCFSKEETNFVKDLQYTYKSLKEAESKLRGIDYSSEIKNLKNRLNNLPNYRFLTNYYIDEFIADASMGLQGAKEVYLITNYYGYAFLYTNKTSFKTKGAFSMYVKVVPANGAKSTLPEQAQKAYKSANISSLFVEISDEEYRRNEEEKKSLINQIDELEHGVSTFNNLKHGIENKIDEIKSDLSKNLLYDSAIAALESKNYEEAYEKFTNLKGFKDSEKRLLECGSDSIYESAVSLLNEGKYQEALNKFKTISFYKDSINKIKECERNNTYETAINLFNNKSYLEAKEQFEKVKEFKDSSNKLLECQDYINQSEYETALNLLNNKNYEEALKKFKTISSYKDSSSKILECEKNLRQITYDTALNLLNNKNYSEAKEKFYTIVDFKDSSKKILECEDNIKQQIYDSAMALNTVKKYEEAMEKFRTIVDYKDSAKKILECEDKIKQKIYDCAVALKTARSYKDAMDKFQSIKDYKDSANKIIECENGIIQLEYESAVALLNDKRYKEAIEKFKSIIDYKDSKSKIKECSENQFKNWVSLFEIPMVVCPAGQFVMGSPKSEIGRSSDEDQINVIVPKAFAIGKYEVTQAQYEAIMGKKDSEFKGVDKPITSINYSKAMDFIGKLNEKYSYSLPEGYRFDLPNEAHWEYACRAGTKSALNNGKDLKSNFERDLNLDELAWYKKNSGDETHNVGQRKPNAWGIYDMHGNVYELCRDFQKENNYIIRGGTCVSYPGECRSAWRRDAYGIYPPFIGFRLALLPTSYDDIDMNENKTNNSLQTKQAIFITDKNNVRSLPNANADLIAVPVKGTKCTILEQKDRWYKVKFDSTVGWTSISNLKFEE